MVYFDNNLCNNGDEKCNDPSICWDFTVFKGINFASFNSIEANLDAVWGLKIFSRGLKPLRTLLGVREGGSEHPPPPDPPAMFGHANACMLATLAFPVGAWQPQLQFSG